MKKLKWIALVIIIIGIVFIRSKIEDRNQKEANIIEHLEDDQSYSAQQDEGEDAEDAEDAEDDEDETDDLDLEE